MSSKTQKPGLAFWVSLAATSLTLVAVIIVAIRINSLTAHPDGALIAFFGSAIVFIGLLAIAIDVVITALLVTKHARWINIIMLAIPCLILIGAVALLGGVG